MFMFKKSVFISGTKKYRDYDIGEYTYGNPKIMSWNREATVKIGRYCSIADDVTIMTGGEHRIDWVTTYPFNYFFKEAFKFKGHPKTKGDVIIGNDVWICQGVLILSGVKIGDGAVIGAKSVVTKDVEPYSIVGGNPARHIRFRFEEETRNDLLKIAWWNWPMQKILDALPLLLSDDIRGFTEKYK